MDNIESQKSLNYYQHNTRTEGQTGMTIAEDDQQAAQRYTTYFVNLEESQGMNKTIKFISQCIFKKIES